MRRLLRSLALVSLGVASCTQSGTYTTIVPETALSVEPKEFLGAVTCGEDAAQMHAYVATLVDVSGFETSYLDPAMTWRDSGITELTLPSSAPTACFLPVLFQRVVVGRQYRAEIDGYDRKDIAPLAPGSRIMVDAAKVYVAPRWTTACGSHWSAPRDGDRGAASDAGTTTDGGRPDAGATEPGPVVEARPDAAVAYGDCRGNRLLDAGVDGAPPPRPWLGGPVCAYFEATIPFRGCDPLRDAYAATK